jgi:hypothetical protein
MMQEHGAAQGSSHNSFVSEGLGHSCLCSHQLIRHELHDGRAMALLSTFIAAAPSNMVLESETRDAHAPSSAPLVCTHSQAASRTISVTEGRRDHASYACPTQPLHEQDNLAALTIGHPSVVSAVRP